MKEYKILVYLQSLSGVTYHRLLLPYKKLETTYKDIKVEFIGNKRTNQEVIEMASSYDAFVFSRNCDTDLLRKLKGKITIIDDIDDWWELDRTHGLYYQFKYDGIAANMRECCELADYVTTTTKILAYKILYYNENYVIFDNALEPFGQYIPKVNPSKRIRFGIIGSSSHNNDMTLLNNIITYIPKKYRSKMQFVLCGFDKGTVTTYKPDGTKSITDANWDDVCWVKWEKNLTENYKLCSPAYAEYLQKYDKDAEEPDPSDEFYRRIWSLPCDQYAKMYDEIDVLLVPLLATPFNRCKSELKMVEASVKHKPVIVNRVEPYTPLIRHNENCISTRIGRKAQGFAEAIVKFICKPEKVEQYGNELAKLTEPGAAFNLSTVTKARYEWLTKILQH